MVQLEGRLLSYYEQVRQERSGISWLAYLPKDIFMEVFSLFFFNSLSKKILSHYLASAYRSLFLSFFLPRATQKKAEN
jgi:hypothetical protein